MYVCQTAPRGMDARSLVKGDEIAFVYGVDGKPAPLRSADSVSELAPLITWVRIRESRLMTPAEIREDRYPALGGVIIRTDSIECQRLGCPVENCADEFYVPPNALVVVRIPVEVEEIDFVEHMINRLDILEEDATALRTLTDAGDGEGQRDSAEATPAEMIEPVPAGVYGAHEGDPNRADAESVRARSIEN